MSKKIQVNSYFVTNDVAIKFVNFRSDWLMDDSTVRRNANSYIEFFKMMIYLEEADEMKDMQKNNLNRLTIHPLTGKKFYFRIAVSWINIY